MNALLEARAQLTEGKAASVSTPPTLLSRASIAVLSFRNLANDPEIEYFGDGLAEELITALTKVDGIRVAARTSTFTFMGKDVDIRDVGERLKVNAVLDGSVRKTANGIRVSCQLLNTEDGYELWSEPYDRELADVLMLQEDITRAITDDPEYALAYSGLADTLVFRGLYSLERPRDAFVRAEKHVAKALSIESRVAEAHTSLALILLSAYWDWSGAENEFLRATELDPMEAQAHIYYSWLLAMLGRHWEAGVAAKRAQDIDPLSPLVNSGVAWMYRREYRPRNRGIAEVPRGRSEFSGGVIRAGIVAPPEGGICTGVVTD